jgi:hypothetical protein
MTIMESDMETFKFEIFQKENPGIPLFEVISLPSSRTHAIQQQLFKSLQIEGSSGHQLDKRLHNDAKILAQSVFDERFSIESLFNDMGFHDDFVYVTWDTFTNIDQIHLKDFCKWFQYIWYPSSDDIDVFNDELTWILHIYHYGTIALTQLRSEATSRIER